MPLRQGGAFAGRGSRSRKPYVTRTLSDTVATIVEIALVTLTFIGILPAALVFLLLSLPAWAAVFVMVGVGVLAVAYSIRVCE